MGKLSTSKRNMLISRFYTDACLNRVDERLLFIARRAMWNPRYVSNHTVIQEHYFVEDNTGRRLIPAICNYMIIDRKRDDWKVLFPHQFFKTNKLQRYARNKTASMTVNMQHKYALKRSA